MTQILSRRADGTFVIVRDGFPYHVTRDNPLFDELSAPALNAPLEEPVPVLTVGQLRAGMSLTFAQLLIGLVAEGWITEAEGEAWLTGVLPAPVLGLIAGLPPSARFAARARAARPSIVLRTDPLVVALGAVQNKSEVELDAFFERYARA